MDGDSHPARPRLKIALYQPWIYLHGGLERTVLELVTRSRHDWTIYTGHFDADSTFPGFAALDVQTLRPTSVDRRMVNVLSSAVQVFLQKLPDNPARDAVVVCCDGIGDMLTFRNNAVPLFNLCFTPMRAVFDPWYEKMALKHRNWYQRLIYAAFKLGFRMADRAAWKRFRGIVAVSNEVKQRIVAGELCEPGRVVIAHPGIDWSPELGPIDYEPYILVSGRIMWTKNIEFAIRAFREAALPLPWRLVIAGYVDRKSTPYLAQLRDLAAGCGAIEFVVSPTDEAMRALMRRASFSLFTPLNEDWGIVPLESMAMAKPVIAMDLGGPRESVIDGGTGYLLPPREADWAACMRRLAADPDLVRRLGTEGRLHVQQFTWARFAADVDDAIEAWMSTMTAKASVA